MTLVELGKRIQKMRMIKGLSAYELSLRVGKDTSYIYKVETGRINVSIKVILDICEVLEISPKDLF